LQKGGDAWVYGAKLVAGDMADVVAAARFIRDAPGRDWGKPAVVGIEPAATMRSRRAACRQAASSESVPELRVFFCTQAAPKTRP
jgi:hypothetical protein